MQCACINFLFRSSIRFARSRLHLATMPAKRKSARASDIAAKKAKEDMSRLDCDLEWKEEGQLKPGIPELIYLDGKDALHSSKVAGFDIDWTIIKTKSGKKFPTGQSDWTFLYDSVPKKLRELHDAGTKVIFYTNQGGIEKGKQDTKSLLAKIEDIINAVGIPIQVFVSTGNTHYRKPSTAMWDFMVSRCNGGLKVDPTISLYVGDAAGRPKSWAPGKPKDFSAGDRMFAANVGCQFATPEEYFLGEKPSAVFNWGSFDIKKFMSTAEDSSIPSKLHSDNQELVVFVGRPASGKSTLRDRYFTPHNYTAVNRDTLGTKEKCVKVANEAIKGGKSVVVDNTNPSKADRKLYIDLATKAGIPARCMYFNVDITLAHHLNMFRQNQSQGERRRVPEVAYRTYEKNFEKPDSSEGFLEIVELDFVPQFDNDGDKDLFSQWTCMS